MVAVLLDGLEILLVDVLVRVLQQGAAEGLLRVPGLGPGLQVLLYGLGNALVMGGHYLGAIVPVHLWGASGGEEKGYKCFKRRDVFYL